MNCSNCGAEFRDDLAFCPDCGAPVAGTEEATNLFATETQHENSRRFDINAPDIPGFGGAVATCFRKYFCLRGRASRSEYWRWVLFVVLTYWLPFWEGRGLLRTNVVLGRTLLIASSILWLVCFIPGICVGVRRLHDIGRSGWFILLRVVPLSMYVFILILGRITIWSAHGLPEEYLPEAYIRRVWSRTITLLLLTCCLLFVGKFILAVLACLQSQKGDNKYGKEPVKRIR